ncbi:MAG: riboflavin synthase [Armatimonadetes bacterium]|nr:riboflavin synthase [Armatimonadota bacterium]
MFTGLIREIGTILSVRPTATGRDLVVRCPLLAAEALTGDSIAANGVCLTVTALTGDGYACHAGAETLGRSTAGSWEPGRRLNLEPALRVGDRLGGHFVQGHVDCVGRCVGRQARGETVLFEFSLPPEQSVFLVEKGSVAVDGISLTVTGVRDDVFGVAIIPHTLAQTTLQDMQPGQDVNIEVDILAKYVHRALGLRAGGITSEFLAEHGYM